MINNIISIDPDIEKSGVAYYTPAQRVVKVQELSFPETLDYLRAVARQCQVKEENMVVIVEAGWLNESNWHVKFGDSHRYAAKVGSSVGRNQEVGILILECCKHWKIPAAGIKPLPLKIRVGRKYINRWKGKDGKITQEEILEYLKGKRIKLQAGRMNQDARDAVLLATSLTEPIILQHLKTQKTR